MNRSFFCFLFALCRLRFGEVPEWPKGAACLAVVGT